MAQRVLIVDDHLAFAEAVAIAVDLQADLECVGATPSVEDALRLTEDQHYPPDVVLMDVYLPGVDGIEGTRRIKARNSETRVLILTGHTELDILTQAATAGASGFLPKESSLQEVIDAIRVPVDDKIVMESSTLAALIERLRDTERASAKHARDSARLTRRELEVLGHMREGLDPQAIALRLGISVHTCRGHVKSLLLKLGAHSQLEAVVIAAREGLLPDLSV
jgi:DNA-binding NarL/FixJ family response regulator